jgi:hypothetical protein
MDAATFLQEGDPRGNLGFPLATKQRGTQVFVAGESMVATGSGQSEFQNIGTSRPATRRAVSAFATA